MTSARGSSVRRDAQARMKIVECSPSPNWEPVPALNLDVTPLTARELLGRLDTAVKNGASLVVAAHNLHSAYLFHRDPKFALFYKIADITVLDGWPVLALLNRDRKRRGLAPLPSAYRIGSTDWLPAAIALPSVARVCVLGATPASNDAFIARAKETNPGVQFLGIAGNPWRPDGIDDVARAINSFRPDLTIVGMGMPLQESIVLQLLAQGLGGVIATTGGAIDQLSGAQLHAPRWTGRLRVEWLWRLASDPRRLAYRYLIEPFKLWRLIHRQRPAVDP